MTKNKETTTISAGILLYRFNEKLEIYLAHMGGPYWERKDKGAWSIPKGLVEDGEDILKAAIREFTEETGYTPISPFHELGSVQMRNKEIHIWTSEAPMDLKIEFRSNTFKMEWPPKSGVISQFSEMDRAEWFSPEIAIEKLVPVQTEFIKRLQNLKPDFSK